MRTGGIILLLFLAAIFGGVIYLRHTSVYIGFKHKSNEYHAEFAEACDSVLAQHPPGTNEAIELSVSDPSLPRIITDLHPLKVVVFPNQVWILVSESHVDGLAVFWEPQWQPQNQTQTNTWNLGISSGEGPPEFVYFGSRK